MRPAPVRLALALIAPVRLALVLVRYDLARALLALLGALLGTAAMLVCAALARHACEHAVVANLQSNALWVTPRQEIARKVPLSERDVKAIIEQSPRVAAAAGYVRADTKIAFGERSLKAEVLGTSRAFFVVQDSARIRGESWSESAERSGERVCVLGRVVASTLFGPVDPIGRIVRVGRYPMRVLGVLEDDRQSPWGSRLNQVVAIPLSTFRAHVVHVPVNRLHAIVARATSSRTTGRAKTQVTALLRERHRIVEGREDDFIVQAQSDTKPSPDISSLATWLLIAGLVACGCGALAFANGMLGVGNRAHGSRILAVGGVLSIAGALLGAALAHVLVRVLRPAWGPAIRLDTNWIVYAVAVSAMLGLVSAMASARFRHTPSGR